MSDQAMGAGSPQLAPSRNPVRLAVPGTDSRRRWVAVGARCAVALLGLIVLPMITSEYWLYLVTMWFAYALAVLGMRVLFGICGQLSLAQATFIGVGAYTAGIVITKLSVTAPYEFLIVVAVSAVAALIVGLPALRVGGLRLALLTLAFGSLFTWWLIEAQGTTGGEQGLFIPPMLMGNIDTTNPMNLYWTCAAFAVIGTLLVIRLPHTALGRSMAAIREAETAARSVGVRIGRTKLIAFVISGVFAGVSGWLIAHVSGSISPSSFDLFPSVYVLVAVVLGGARSTVGAWIGAAYISLVPAIFSQYGKDEWYVFLSGALLVVCISVLPNGLVSIVSLVLRAVRRLRNVPASDSDERPHDRSTRHRPGSHPTAEHQVGEHAGPSAAEVRAEQLDGVES